MYLFPREPRIRTVLQMRLHQGLVEGQDHFPQPAGKAHPNALQDSIGLSWSQGHFWPLESLLSTGTLRAAFQEVSSQPVQVPGIIPPQVQDPAFAFVEFLELPLHTILQAVQVSLDVSTGLWGHSSWFCNGSELAEDASVPSSRS